MNTWKSSNGAAAFEAATAYPCIRAYAEMANGASAASTPSTPFAARVFVGLVPPGAWRAGWSASIPDRLRLSPLRLIFLNLQELGNKLRKEDVLLSFLDCDAF